MAAMLAASALLLLAQAAGTAAPAAAAKECSPDKPAPTSDTIVICAPKTDGFRLNPDVVEARRLKKRGDAGHPRNPHEAYKDNSCATVGPMGCRGGPTLNVLAAAATAAQMAERLSKGQEVGSMLVTDPHPSEYQLYLEAKKRREEKQADAAAATVKATAEAAAPAATAQDASAIQKQ